MKNVNAVIGSAFGDEGKGLMTDYLSAKYPDGIVVRFNGGAQAGHTVVTPDNRRHIFGHIGSGAFVGLPTFLSSFFVTNPILFKKEIAALKEQGVTPTVYVDGDCLVTTPYDMMINQAIEKARGASRHGSCGVGFNETIQRNTHGNYKLLFKDLVNERLVRDQLEFIRRSYVPQRLKELNADTLDYLKYLLEDNGILETYITDIWYMLESVTIASINVLRYFDDVIFEGAQGLLLDQNHHYFPYVTRSNTGLQNAVSLVKQYRELVSESDLNIEATYVTRGYLTRHGAGPFTTETSEKPCPRIIDKTNMNNAYQGSLRFGLINLDVLSESIRNDLGKAQGFNVSPKLAITCLDQVEAEVEYFQHGIKHKTSKQDFIQNTLETISVGSGFASYGETREAIEAVQIKEATK